MFPHPIFTSSKVIVHELWVLSRSGLLISYQGDGIKESRTERTMTSGYFSAIFSFTTELTSENLTEISSDNYSYLVEYNREGNVIFIAKVDNNSKKEKIRLMVKDYVKQFTKLFKDDLIYSGINGIITNVTEKMTKHTLEQFYIWNTTPQTEELQNV